jgi:probable phosphomutase (TIGR03848 family)
MTSFLLIRHAMTDVAGKRLVGRMPDVSLNEEGFSQAENLSRHLTGSPVTAIYSSPLQRAIETAAPVAKALKLDPVISEDFNEIEFGEWTNCDIKSLENDEQFQRFNLFRSSQRIPGGESMQEAQLRIINGVRKLQIKYPGKMIVVVTHSDMIKAAIAYYAGIPLDMMQRIEISPASVSVIELYPDTAIIKGINNTGSLQFLVPGSTKN